MGKLIKIEMTQKDYRLYQKYKSNEMTLRTKMLLYVVFVVIQLLVTYYIIH